MKKRLFARGGKMEGQRQPHTEKKQTEAEILDMEGAVETVKDK